MSILSEKLVQTVFLFCVIRFDCDLNIFSAWLNVSNAFYFSLRLIENLAQTGNRTAILLKFFWIYLILMNNFFNNLFSFWKKKTMKVPRYIFIYFSFVLPSVVVEIFWKAKLTELKFYDNDFFFSVPLNVQFIQNAFLDD